MDVINTKYNKYKPTIDMYDALSVISQFTNDIVIITDKYGYITWVNDGFVNLTEYIFEEAQGSKTDPETTKKLVMH